MLEAICGIGLIIGPVIGSMLYTAVGFKHAFFIYGGVLMMIGFVIKLNFTERAPTDEQD